MRLERLVIDAGGRTCTLDLHPRLTVVAGVGPLERAGLTAELLGALGGGRPGLSAEVVEDRGRRLAVARPHGAHPRVVDVDAMTDAGREFASGGDVDLLLPSGLPGALAHRKLRFGAEDLAAASRGTALVRRLATADQEPLWEAAEALAASDTELRRRAEGLGTVATDVDVVEQIEARHLRTEAARTRHDRIRRLTTALSAVAGIGAAGGVWRDDPVLTVAMLVIAVVFTLCSAATRWRLERARRHEGEALAEAGVSSYLGFHLQRVNGMLSDDAGRRGLVAAAEANHRARARWRELAGEANVAWALERREEISAAARVRVDVSDRTTATLEADGVEDATTDLARVLVARLAELRALGGGTESYPLVLDDPFADVPTSDKPGLLELLGHAGGAPQLVYLTDDDDVAGWARLEALTGNLSIIEPDAEPAGTR